MVFDVCFGHLMELCFFFHFRISSRSHVNSVNLMPFMHVVRFPRKLILEKPSLLKVALVKHSIINRGFAVNLFQ